MIKFKYKPNENLSKLISEQIPQFNYHLTGYADGNLINQLRYCKLYLVYKVDIDEHTNQASYSDPLAIVALNAIDAVGYYDKIKQCDNGTVMCELEGDCSKMKVEHA